MMMNWTILLQRTLGFDPATMKVRREVMAGATTFLTMCYILAVNPAVLSTTGMDRAALFTATAVVSAIATLLLAFMAKLPFAQAPSVGLNAFFAFTLCQSMGYAWEQSLAIMLIEGVIFILITFVRLRELILDSIPPTLRYAISAGIGMFIAFVGLKNAGIVVADESTYVRLGEFTPMAILGVVAILLSGVLMVRRVKGALFYGIIIASLVGIPLGVTKIPSGWMPVSAPHSMESIFCKFDFSGMLNVKTVMVVFSLLMVNLFDTLGTLIGLAQRMGIEGRGGSIPRIKEAMMSDAIGTTCGAFLGSSTITTYVESASGIAEGGRSGMTALVVGVLFLLSMFLSPIFLLIPGAATSGALVMVGALMLDAVKRIELDKLEEAFPAFITMLTMVLCYSIADGICLGMVSYVVVKLCAGRYRDLNPTLCVLSALFVLYFLH